MEQAENTKKSRRIFVDTQGPDEQRHPQVSGVCSACMNKGLKTISNVLKESFITLKKGNSQRERWHSASRDRTRRVDPDFQLKSQCLKTDSDSKDASDYPSHERNRVNV